jgi:hypothetical protein
MPATLWKKTHEDDPYISRSVFLEIAAILRSPVQWEDLTSEERIKVGSVVTKSHRHRLAENPVAR